MKRKKLKVSFYEQQLLRGCGAASLLMAMHFFEPGRFPLIRKEEGKIYEAAKFGEGESASYSGLARYALQNGFKAKLYSRCELPGRPMEYTEELYQEHLHVYSEQLSEALDLGLITQVGDFELANIILEDIYAGRLIICLIKLKEEFLLHNILVIGHENNWIHYIDPLHGYRRGYLPYLEKEMEISFTKTALAIWKE